MDVTLTGGVRSYSCSICDEEIPDAVAVAGRHRCQRIPTADRKRIAALFRELYDLTRRNGSHATTFIDLLDEFRKP